MTHPYSDYAMEVDTKGKVYPNTKKGGVQYPFPAKLFQLLEHIDLHEPHLADIVSWQPSGRCFLVRDAKRFEELVLPKFFKQTMYSSFRRQLNLWGFKRLVQKSPDRGAYYHERFLRNKPFLHCYLSRSQQERDAKNSKPSRTTRASPNPDYEPDFYSMTALPPSSSSISTRVAVGHGCCPLSIPLFSPQDETKADVGDETSIDNELVSASSASSSMVSFTKTPFSPLICDNHPSTIVIPSVSVAGTPLTRPRSSNTSIANPYVLDLSFLDTNENDPHFVHSASQMSSDQGDFRPANESLQFFRPQQAAMTTCSTARASDAEEGHGYTSSVSFEHYRSYDWEPYNVGNAPTLSFEVRSEIVTVVRNIE